MAGSSVPTATFYCEFCQLGFNFASKYHIHLKSSRHRSLAAILQNNPLSGETEVTEAPFDNEVEDLSPTGKADPM